METQALLITDKDARQLRFLLERDPGLDQRDREYWRALEDEVEKAMIVPEHEIPANVVTMHSRVRIIDMRTGEQRVFQLVFPSEANYSEGKISVLAPIGMALLGYAAGTEIEWKVPSGYRRLLIAAVEQRQVTQPQRAA